MLDAIHGEAAPLLGREQERTLLDGVEDRARSCFGSHSIYVSQPRATADLIERAAREALVQSAV
jgi:hypothetical protein